MALVVRNCFASAGDSGDMGSNPKSLSQEDPLEKEGAAHTSILNLGNSVDSGAWQSAVHGAAKSQT